MGIISEYLTLQKQSQLEHGPKTVVLLQVGVFYEIYQYCPEYCSSDLSRIDKNGVVWNVGIGHAINLSVVLNSLLTYENKNEPYSISNCHKVGFPIISYEKNLSTLLSNDYVVKRYDQRKDDKDHVTRFLAETQNPTMQLDNITLTTSSSNVASIYIEYHHHPKSSLHNYDNFVITTGVSVVDIITGNNRVAEFYSKTNDQIYAVQELYRFLISHYPRELILNIADMPPGLDSHSDSLPNPYFKYLERILELRRFNRITVNVNKVPPDYKKIPYQIEFLNKLFSKPSPSSRLNIVQKRNENIIESLGLERLNYGRIAYMLLMQHCYIHNSKIIASLSNPDVEWIDEHKHLILTHNAIIQLDLISPLKLQGDKSSEIDSLMSVLDHTQTHLGKRLLHSMLQNPMLDPIEINSYYTMVSEMLSSDTPLWLILDRQLKELTDIGRLQRKLEIKLISPKELTVLFSSYIKIVNIYITVHQTNSPVLHSKMLQPSDVSGFNSFLTYFSPIIDFDALECCYIDTSESGEKWLEFVDCPIKIGNNRELDEKREKLMEAEKMLQDIVDHLNGFLTHTRGKKIEFKAGKKRPGAKKQDTPGTVLTTTAAKASELTKSPINNILCGKIEVVAYTASDKIITSDKISELCKFIDDNRMWMRQFLYGMYDNILDQMFSNYSFYLGIATFVAKLDLIHSYAKVSSLYNYHRPDIIADDRGVSYLEARELRHPIIERIIDGVYVTNDIFLGDGNDTRSGGIVLFGVNQTGKSSLSKALALNIIMAQIGCFVPSKLRYVPYAKIITRISGSDNIFKGQSSFALEMSELRTILRQADGRTLVIGDEIAKGTETNSGMAIAAASILSLVKSGTSFMFATHMHDLLKLSSIKNLTKDKVKICHLAVDYDSVIDSLIYNRKIMDGCGTSIYGLVVAKSLGLPDEFMNLANTVLVEITGKNSELVATTKSRYNGKVYIDVCAMCDKTSTQIQLHTHHIIEQKNANGGNMVRKIINGKNGEIIDVGMMHKNAKDNLITLCKECHVELHRKKEELETLTLATGTIVILKSPL